VPNGQGIGFATPASMADKIIAQLKHGKRISRGWLGITMQDLDENTAKAVGSKSPKASWFPTSFRDPADKGGLKIGDVILRVNGQSLDGPSALLSRVAAMRPGERIQLGVRRQNRLTELAVVLGERKSALVAGQQDKGSAERAQAAILGLSLRPGDGGEEAQALGLQKPQGLVVLEVKADAPASQIDIQPGDVIIEANQRPTNTVAQLKSVVGESRQKGLVMLLLKRQGQNLLRAIPLDKK
jgi:serine protease Do